MLPVVSSTASADEVAKLKDEVAGLQAKLDRRARWQARGRRFSLTLLLVLGCGLVALSLIAAYVRVDSAQHRSLRGHDGADRREPAGPAGGRRQARQPRSTSRVDFDALLREALPPRADPLAPALATGLQQAIRSRLDAFVASDDSRPCGTRRTGAPTNASSALLTTGESGGCGWRATPSTSTSARRSTASGAPCKSAGSTGSRPPSRRASTAASRCCSRRASSRREARSS